jgi:hypothetical protein
VTRRISLVIGLLIVAFLFQQTVFLGLTTSTLARADVGQDAILSYSSPAARPLSYSWAGWRPATCMPDGCFCEPVRPGAIRQPVNTWSNLAFVLTGLFVIGIGLYDLTQASRSGTFNPMRHKFVYPAVYGIVTILIGMGSIFYHVSLAFAGQVVDIISIYLLTSFMLLYNLSRTRPMGNEAFVGLYLLLNVLLGYISIRVPVLRRYIFLALLVAVLVSEVIVRRKRLIVRRKRLIVRRKRRPRMKVAFMVAALVSLVLGCTAWILDVTRVVCAPDSWLQGHAMWHVFMAAVIGFMYLYYRSELDISNICSYNTGRGNSGRAGETQAAGAADLLRAGGGGCGVAPPAAAAGR